MRHPRPEWALARVFVDLLDAAAPYTTINPEKSGVHLAADLIHAVERSVAKDGTNFRGYLDDAGDAFKASKRRTRRRTPILQPGQGVHPRVKRAIERESPILEGEKAVRIRWKRMTGEDFVKVDRPHRTLWLNDRYRAVVLRGHTAGVNDAPLLKSLLFLLYEDLFRGQAMGAKDKENQHFWNEVLTSAAQSEDRDQN